MSTSMLLGLFDWIGDFFKSLFDLIPKIMYLLYASMACVLDVLQLFFRKLAGLDVYYIDGEAVQGDIVTNFITGILGIKDGRQNMSYSALSTVFWSMIVFGIIICFASTIIAIIKSHYSYDEKAAKGPMQYVYTAGKAIINMIAVPVIVVLGMYVSEAILTALDTITSTNSGVVDAMYGTEKGSDGKEVNLTDKFLVKVDTRTGKKTSIYYDIFGVHSGVVYGAGGGDEGSASENQKKYGLIAASSQPFSGSLFKVAAFNGNRARLGQISIEKNFTGGKNSTGEFKLFANAKDNDQLADMIDTAFACNLHAKNWFGLKYEFGDIVSMKYFTNYLTLGTNSFSKFNVGLVWYYYDLWQFNFIVGFAGIIVCVSIFINVILGLITRLFMCIVLFLVAPPLFGLAPLDGGKAGKGWRENFMKQALMAYGAVVGMNLVLMILPYMNEIDFFNIAIADYFAQTLVIIVGLITIKAVIATLSGLIGAADANETGGKIKDEVADVAGKATKMTVGAAKIGGKIGGKVGMAIGSDMIKAGGKLGGLIGKIGYTEKDANGNPIIGKDGKPVRHTLGGLASGIASGTGKAGGFVKAGAGKVKSGAGWLKNHIVGQDEENRTMFGQFLLGGTRTSKRKLKKSADAAAEASRLEAQAAAEERRGDTKAAAMLRKEARDKQNLSDTLKAEATTTSSGSAIAGMVKGGAQGLLGKAFERNEDGSLKKDKDGKPVGGSGIKGMLSLANAKLNVAKASIDGNGFAGAVSKALGDASKNLSLKDKDGKGAMGQMLSLAHDGLLKNDSGLGKFLDSSEIKKKPDHDKTTATSTAAMAKNTEEMKASMANMSEAIDKLAAALNKKKD